MKQRISVAKAADEIGCAKEYLRRQMRSGRWDIGEVIKPPRGGSNYQYFVFRAKLDKFLGIQEQDMDEMGG